MTYGDGAVQIIPKLSLLSLCLIRAKDDNYNSTHPDKMLNPKFFVTSLLLLSSSISAATVPVPQVPLPHQQSSFETSKDDLSKVISASPLLSLHKALVEIDSTSSYELAVGEFLVSTLEAHNFKVTSQQVDDVNNASLKRWNIYATTHSSQHPLSKSRKQPHPKVILTSTLR